LAVAVGFTEESGKAKVLAADSQATESRMGNSLWSLQAPKLIMTTKSPSGDVVVDVVKERVVLEEAVMVSEAVQLVVCEVVPVSVTVVLQDEVVVEVTVVVVVLVCVQFVKTYPAVCTGRQLI